MFTKYNIKFSQVSTGVNSLVRRTRPVPYIRPLRHLTRAILQIFAFSPAPPYFRGWGLETRKSRIFSFLFPAWASASKEADFWEVLPMPPATRRTSRSSCVLRRVCSMCNMHNIYVCIYSYMVYNVVWRIVPIIYANHYVICIINIIVYIMLYDIWCCVSNIYHTRYIGK